MGDVCSALILSWTTPTVIHPFQDVRSKVLTAKDQGAAGMLLSRRKARKRKITDAARGGNNEVTGESRFEHHPRNGR